MTVSECKVDEEGIALEKWLTEAMKEEEKPLVVLGFLSSDRYVRTYVLLRNAKMYYRKAY